MSQSNRPLHNTSSFFTSILSAIFLLALGAWTLMMPTTVKSSPAESNQTFFDSQIGFGDLEYTAGVAVGDFNGDGRLDVVAGHIDGNAELYLRNPQDEKSFLPGQPIAGAQGYPAAGDLNNDGYLDLVIGATVYTNNGDGSFAAGVPLPEDPFDLEPIWGDPVLIDFEGDGYLDIISASATEGLYLHFNNRDGTYSAFSYVNVYTGTLAVGDITGDGRPDLVVGSDIFHNNGEGIFFLQDNLPSAGDAIKIADVDNDGALDILVGRIGSNNEVYLNDGSGFFNSDPDDLFGGQDDDTTGIDTADLDGDGDLDIVVSLQVSEFDSVGKQNKVFYNNGFGLFGESGVSFGGENNTTDLKLADIDGNGALDVVTSNNGRPGFVYFNSNSGGFELREEIGTEADTYDVAVGDINGDGQLDIVTANDGPNTLQINLSGTFSETTVGGFTLSYDVALADLNGDSQLEILSGNFGPNEIYNPADNSTSFFGDVNAFTNHLATGDLNNDNTLDIVASNSGVNFIYYNDGTGTLSAGTPFGGGGTYAAALGDFNDDGRLDIVTGNYGGGTDYVYLNSGDNTWDQPIPLTGAHDTVGVDVGDVDGDGDIDIVAANDNQQYFVYLNDGQANFDQIKAFGDADLTSDIILGDIDNDGDLDAATANLGRVNFIYLNDGAGNFGQGFPFGYSESGWGIALGDLDGDGYLDIVEGNTLGDNYVHYNNFRAVQGRENNPSTLAVSRPVETGDADFFSSPEVLSERYISVTYTVADLENDPVGYMKAFYSLDGGDNWQPAVAAASSVTTNLATSFSNEAVVDTFLPNGTTNVPLSFSPADAGKPIVDLELETSFDHFTDSTLSASLVSDWPTAGTTIKLFENLSVTEFGSESLITFRDSAIRSIEEATSVPVQETYISVDIPQTILPEDPNTINSEITVAGGTTEILDVNVINIQGTHTYVGDLIFTLISPSGTEVILTLNECGSEDNFNFSIDDQAPSEFLDCPPTSGVSYQPFQPLSIFNGEDSNGVWTLRVDDTASADGGELQGWGLEISGPGTVTTFADANFGLALPIGPDAGTETVSTLFINGGPTAIKTLEVVNLVGTHTFLGDLTFTLESPSGITVTLINRICGADDDFNLNFVDRASPIDEENDCPPTGGFSFAPEESLSAFEGENSNGTWTLRVVDNASGDEGLLDSWGLRINPQYPINGAYQPLEPLSTFSGAPADATFTLVITNSEGTVFEDTLYRWQLRSIGHEHTYVWDTFDSSFFGRSDNVVLRMEAYAQLPDGAPLNQPFTYFDSAGGDRQWPYASATTFPFSVRGTQIQVLSGTQPVENAVIYRLPAGQTAGAELIASPTSGQPYRTNSDGFLQGRGALNPGDQLMALVPIDMSEQVTFTEKYRLFYTSATINPLTNSPDLASVDDFGVQTLVVSPQNTLTLYDLDISLEWDARNDPSYISELTANVRRASEILYDVTNGQVALGDVRIHHAKENWNYADVVIFAANDVRPSAAAGGVVISPTNDIINASTVITDAYLPGQVRMGPTWSRFGDPDSNLGEDWSRAFAHELSHFFFFLPDNYVGFEGGQVVSVDCYGSFMTDIYNEDYSEFLEESGWVGDCLKTVAETITGRNDWQTIQQYWPWLDPNPLLSGPAVLPLDVTTVTEANGDQPSNTLTAPFFSLRDINNNPIPVRDGQGQGYLFKNQDTADLSDDYLIALGSPRGDQMQARGAAPGDRLCVYDFTLTDVRLGCDTVGEVESNVTLYELTGWNPQILVSAQSSVTLAITVTQATTQPLKVQILPSAGLTDTFPIFSTVADLNSVSAMTHTQLVTLPYPVANGHIRIWADGATPAQEMVTNFMLGEGFDANRSGFNANRSGFNANRSGFNANRSGFNAPIASGDGTVKIYNVEDVFADTGTLSLQALNETPSLPSWLSPVGKAYRFESSTLFPRIIAFEYLQTAVPQGTTFEHELQVYYSPDDGQTWQRLTSTVDIGYNLATATMPSANEGEGIYILAATIEMAPLSEGWNLFAYPIPFTRTLPLALDSLGENYTSVYLPQQSGDWLLYDQTVPAALSGYVNTLPELSFGTSYWLYATNPVTPYLGLPSSSTPRNVASVSTLPPATFFGEVLTTADFIPALGMTIEARINGQLCGSSIVESWQNQLVYKVQVTANNGDGCGASGAFVTFMVDGQTMASAPLWNNTQAQYHPLSTSAPLLGTRLYLPLIGNGQNNQTIAPDLVVRRIDLNGGNIAVTIANDGNAPLALTDEFWVDVYIDPIRTPTANDIWNAVADEGLVWGITADALPLAPGDTLELTINDAYYQPTLSSYSGTLASNTPVFAQVDSAHAGIAYGAVLEIHEIDNTAYNNIHVVVYEPLLDIEPR